LKVEFDGEGDSGGITEIKAYAGDEAKPLPDGKLTMQETSWGADTSKEVDLPVRDAIERFCYDALEIHHWGWENNDGAYGDFDFLVSENKIELTFNGRYSDTYTESQEF
jgi:hypothetical protein